eukprot:PhF_6_TR37142/c0_g1_i1/m.54660
MFTLPPFSTVRYPLLCLMTGMIVPVVFNKLLVKRTRTKEKEKEKEEEQPKATAIPPQRMSPTQQQNNNKLDVLISTLDFKDINPYSTSTASRRCAASLNHHRTKLTDEGHMEDGDALRGAYTSTLKAFDETQHSVIKQSLRSGSRSLMPDEELTVIHNLYLESLQYALSLPLEVLFTVEAVTQVNRRVRGDPAGTLREGMVRVGTKVFCEPKDVEVLLRNALRHCQHCLCSTGTDESSPFGLAALACISILEIHPFRDGNGRTARIVLSCVLRHAGLVPFLVMFCKTPDSRKTFTEVVKECSARLCVVPMANYILESTAELWHDLGQAWHKKQKQVHTQSMEASVRDHRISLRRSTCPICQSEDPNVSTLCCGAALHDHCLNTWLLRSVSCPCCREGIRKQPRTIVEIPQIRRGPTLVVGGGSPYLSSNIPPLPPRVPQYVPPSPRGPPPAVDRTLQGMFEFPPTGYIYHPPPPTFIVSQTNPPPANPPVFHPPEFYQPPHDDDDNDDTTEIYDDDNDPFQQATQQQQQQQQIFSIQPNSNQHDHWGGLMSRAPEDTTAYYTYDDSTTEYWT